MSENPLEKSSDSAARCVGSYRVFSLVLALTFAIVGMVFLLLPGTVLQFFNEISVRYGFQASPTEGNNFYLVLAVGYMYVVTIIAWLMYRQPQNRILPVLLMNAKLGSSLLSFIAFFAVGHSLIYLVNGIVDGLIGSGIFLMYLQQGRAG